MTIADVGGGARPLLDAAFPERVLEAALDLADRRGWDAVHLHDVADALGIALVDIHRHFGQKDDLAEAWFDRADRAMLEAGELPGWNALAARERLLRAMFAWLDALAPHRRATAEMLRYKLQLEHPHLYSRGLLRVSRTVQWWREAALLPSVGWRREIEELMLSGLFVATLARWLADGSTGQSRTRAWLDRQLQHAEQAALRFAPR